MGTIDKVERKRKYRAEYYKNHKETSLTQSRINKWKHRGIPISEELYEELLNRQNEKCGICRETPSAKKRLGVDHNHQTSKVRGLLCDKCNLGISKLGDSLEGILNAVKYLQEAE